MGDGEAPAFVFLFLSTPSARRATRTGLRFDGENQSISIHALREEGDAFFLVQQPPILIFLSTPSARRATSGGFG